MAKRGYCAEHYSDLLQTRMRLVGCRRVETEERPRQGGKIVPVWDV